jgi:hypothetical protein
MGKILSTPVAFNSWESLKKEATLLHKSIVFLSVFNDYEKYVALKKRWIIVIHSMMDLISEDSERCDGRAAWIEEMDLMMSRLVRKYDTLHKITLDSKEEPLLNE